MLAESEGPLHSSLSLHYSPPWPLTLLFTPRVMATYNTIFQLLLHLHWTKWNLEGVTTRLGALRAMERGVALKLHFLFLLRSRLLHFVNSLCNYFMTRVSLSHTPTTTHPTQHSYAHPCRFCIVWGRSFKMVSPWRQTLRASSVYTPPTSIPYLIAAS